MKHPVVTKYLIQIGTLHYLSNITEGSNNSVGGDIFTQFNKSEGFLLSIMYFLIKVQAVDKSQKITALILYNPEYVSTVHPQLEEDI